MPEPTVWTFFYGSFMNLDVLKQGGFVPERYEVARLSGFDIRIRPPRYLPEPVLVETLDGKWRTAFCYIAPAGESRPASNDHIDRIVGPARQYGFPAWSVARLESFRPGGMAFAAATPGGSFVIG